MIQRLLYFIAGVDRQLMAQCPATDRMWAGQIGFSLCLSFLVVSGVSYYALSYIVAHTVLRAGIAIVVALTIMMFDRALFQSDWFVQGAFWIDHGGTRDIRAVLVRSAGQFVRVGARLTISLGLAWVIALFLELALFSDAISQKIERDRVATNRPVFDQIENYAAGLDRQIRERRAELTSAEQLLLDVMAQAPAANVSTPARPDDDLQESKMLAQREASLRDEVRELEQTVRQQAIDMNAEQFGERVNPTNTGQPGFGRRYEFAKKQKEIAEQTLQSRQAELAEITARRAGMRMDETHRLANEMSRRENDLKEYAAKRQAIESKVETARTSLQRLENERSDRLAKFRAEVLEASYIQQKKDSNDPLVRLSAYQSLKEDPNEGQTIVLFSWMVRLFVIFLEIVPVITKIFFSPPSMYAVKVLAQIQAARIAARSMDWTPSDVAADLKPATQQEPVAAQEASTETALTADTNVEAPATVAPPVEPAPKPRWNVFGRSGDEQKVPRPIKPDLQQAASSAQASAEEATPAAVMPTKMASSVEAAPSKTPPPAQDRAASPERVVVVYSGGGVRDVGKAVSEVSS
jgi:hypothetical protein